MFTKNDIWKNQFSKHVKIPFEPIFPKEFDGGFRFEIHSAKLRFFRKAFNLFFNLSFEKSNFVCLFVSFIQKVSQSIHVETDNWRVCSSPKTWKTWKDHKPHFQKISFVFFQTVQAHNVPVYYRNNILFGPWMAENSKIHCKKL